MFQVNSFIRKVEFQIIQHAGYNGAEELDMESLPSSMYHRSIVFSQTLKTMKYLKKVKSFVDDVYIAECQDVILYGKNKLKKSSYTKALADSFLQVLVGYSKWDPVDLCSEPWTERGCQVASSNILFTLTTAERILRDITYMIDEIVELNLYGCQILTLTMKYTQCGFPSNVNKVFERIHSSVEVVMLREIAIWIIRGELLGDELFVKVKTIDSNETVQDTFQERVYDIDASFVPIHMKCSLAQDILSIGQLLIILKQVPPHIDGTPDVEGGLFGCSEKELFDKFKPLEFNYFRNLASLQKIINEVSSLLNERAVALCWGVGGLGLEMEVLSEVALLTRADLAARFLSTVGDKLLSHPRGIGCPLLFTREWESAAEDLGLDPTVYSSRFKFSLPSCKMASFKDCDTLSVLQLRYRVPWPLHFLVGLREVETMCQAFKLLARVRLARLHATKAHFFTLRGECGGKDMKLDLHLHWLSILALELETYFFSCAAGLSGAARNDLAKESANVFALRQRFHLFVDSVSQALFLPAQNTVSSRFPKNDQEISLCVHSELVKLLGCMQTVFEAILQGDPSAAVESFEICDQRFHGLYRLLNEASSVHNIDVTTPLRRVLTPAYAARFGGSHTKKAASS